MYITKLLFYHITVLSFIYSWFISCIWIVKVSNYCIAQICLCFSCILLTFIRIKSTVFKDVNTPSPFTETFVDPEANRAAKPDHIYMDCMGFGMGNSCLQLTFQACNSGEARLLYDQLAAVCPLMVSHWFIVLKKTLHFTSSWLCFR